jgi:parallel beta-helix repeat protein
LLGNTITGNVSNQYGGGIALWRSENVTLIGNEICGNQAADAGGGVYLFASDALLDGNKVCENVTQLGGGIHVSGSDGAVVLRRNELRGNTATEGGGVRWHSSPNATLEGNDLRDNDATVGGGAYLEWISDVRLTGNRFLGNSATQLGGGVYLESVRPFTLTNNIVAGNGADVSGAGVYVTGYEGLGGAAGSLVNNTLAQNSSGSGEGVAVREATTLTLTNNIVVSHSAGITVAYPARVLADHTLFYANVAGDIGGTGDVTSSHEITGSAPLFVAPVAWDYHIQPGSPAIEAGAPVPWLRVDIDGQRRVGSPDVGADEVVWSLSLPLIWKGLQP